MGSKPRKVKNGEKKGYPTPKQDKHKDPFFREGILNRNAKHKMGHESWESYCRKNRIHLPKHHKGVTI